MEAGIHGLEGLERRLATQAALGFNRDESQWYASRGLEKSERHGEAPTVKLRA